MGETYKRGNVWWIRYTGEDGRTIRRSTKQGTSEGLARQALAAAERELIHHRLGLVDPAAARTRDEGSRPLEVQLEAFCRHLTAKGCTAQHIEHRRLHIRAAAEHAGWTKISHLSGDGAASYLARLSHLPGRYHGTRTAPRTVKEHCTALKAFSKWLAAEGKLPRDPLANLKSPAAPRQHSRRALSESEWQVLEKLTGTADSRYGLTGSERLLVYRTALGTGYRANELRQLRRGAVRREAGRTLLCLDGNGTKNGTEARIDIPDELARALEAEAQANPTRRNLLRLPQPTDMARMLRWDLARARKAWIEEGENSAEQARRSSADFLAPIDSAGERLDFHALRHTFGDWQVKAGVPIEVVQRRMRHHDIRLTLGAYGHLRPTQEQDAVHPPCRSRVGLPGER